MRGVLLLTVGNTLITLLISIEADSFQESYEAKVFLMTGFFTPS
jgi:hypothetical protein